MSKEQFRKNIKRVVSTLFLYLLLFITACDFEPPEKWETPGWYIDLTLPLINKEYSFAELVTGTMFYHDTLNVALQDEDNKDTVSNVIHVTYPITLPARSIPDSIFNINMPSLPMDVAGMGINDSIYILPDPISESISITLDDAGSELNIAQEKLDAFSAAQCFPTMLVAAGLSFPK